MRRKRKRRTKRRRRRRGSVEGWRGRKKCASLTSLSPFPLTQASKAGPDQAAEAG